MYCPNCGNQNSADQKFCRKCGMNLEASSVSLKQQTAGGEITAASRGLEIFGNIVFGGLGVIGSVVVAGLVFAVISRFILTGDNVLVGVVMSLLIVFLFLALVYVIINEVRKGNAAKFRSDVERQLGSAKTAKLLAQSEFVPLPSVVDKTTELLPKERNSRSS